MKEFNLEESKAGKPVCTRYGASARIICWDKEDKEFPIVALIKAKGDEVVMNYTITGKKWPPSHGQMDSDYDLMMASEKHEGWANVYRTSLDSDLHVTLGNVYSTKEKAERMSRDAARYVTTTKIEWEE